jgi:hypothetical protein
MDDGQLNPLKTGVLFVAPCQIMGPGIMTVPHHRAYPSSLGADLDLDALEAELDWIARPSWSFRQLREQVSQFFCRRKHNLSARLPRLRPRLCLGGLLRRIEPRPRADCASRS